MLSIPSIRQTWFITTSSWAPSPYKCSSLLIQPVCSSPAIRFSLKGPLTGMPGTCPFITCPSSCSTPVHCGRPGHFAPPGQADSPLRGRGQGNSLALVSQQQVHLKHRWILVYTCCRSRLAWGVLLLMIYDIEHHQQFCLPGVDLRAKVIS